MRHIPDQSSAAISTGKLATNTNPHFARHTFARPSARERAFGVANLLLLAMGVR